MGRQEINPSEAHDSRTARAFASMAECGRVPVLDVVERFRQTVYRLRTEGEGRDAFAMGVGVFIGCLPFYGFHLALCWLAGLLFGLNRVKLYIAANISNPLLAPLLLLAELQTGAWLRRGRQHQLSLETVRNVNVWTLAGDLLTGSIVIGAVLGLAVGLATASTARRRVRDLPFFRIWRRASDRYLQGGLTSWEFARGKLRGDPIYRELLVAGILPPGATLVDFGCGQGLTLAVLAEVPRIVADGSWPEHLPAAPLHTTLVGIELRPRIAAIARRALGDDAIILTGGGVDLIPETASAVLLFDVLHLLSRSEQEMVIRLSAAALGLNGVLLIREADAAAGWRFHAVRFGNWIKAMVAGQYAQTFQFRSAGEWRTLLEEHDLHAEVRPMGRGTPFGNVLLMARPRPAAMGVSQAR